METIDFGDTADLLNKASCSFPSVPVRSPNRTRTAYLQPSNLASKPHRPFALRHGQVHDNNFWLGVRINKTPLSDSSIAASFRCRASAEAGPGCDHEIAECDGEKADGGTVGIASSNDHDHIIFLNSRRSSRIGCSAPAFLCGRA